uniref:Uncharacterized protein n=1 Tax=Hyaloperonospora arabidopsidis (strain Emoy2) TaxID=559515 RepID=M4B498_HYAAE
MDAFFQKLASSLLFSFEPTKQPKPVPLASGIPPLHQKNVQPQEPQEPRDLPRRRIAHWDKKREKCANCSHIYLKTLSQHPGFCSVDCKSNMVYLKKVNRTILAMKDALHEQRLQQQDEERTPLPQQQDSLEQQSEAPLDDERTVQCKTYAEFGLDSRILDVSHVEWAFSAMY